MTLDDGTTLADGDVFRIKLNADGDADAGRWSYFTFRGFTKNGDVSAYGGDADPNGRRAWHAFTPERVAGTAQLVTPRSNRHPKLKRSAAA